MKNIQGICKDCGNGTLNNELNPAFEIQEGDYDYLVVHCLRCRIKNQLNKLAKANPGVEYVVLRASNGEVAIMPYNDAYPDYKKASLSHSAGCTCVHCFERRNGATR